VRRGDRLRAFAARLFDARTMERVVDPAIADLQAEPASISRYAAVIKLIVLCLPEVSMTLGTASMVSIGVLAFVVAALELRPLAFAWSQGKFEPVMLAYLLPQGLAIAVQIGLAAGILCAYGGRAVSRRALTGIVALSLAASAAAFVNVGWITPAANQAFRERVVRQTPTSAPLARGFPELTFNEVRNQYRMASAIASSNPGAVDSTDLHYLANSYHGRWAVTLAPIVFAMFALALVRRRPLIRWAGALGAGVVYLSYIFYLDVPVLPALDGRWLGGAAWYPELALAAIAVVIMSMTRREAHVATR